MPNSPHSSRKREPFPPAEVLSEVLPDLVEEEKGAQIDNIVPTFGYDLPTMVGVGGSAGAIQSLQVFFETLPHNSGMVYVVILHLSPEHNSAVVDMIGRWTRMPVAWVTDGQKAEVDHVYVVPPGKHMLAENGTFALRELEKSRGPHVAVDLFFRSLADSHGAHAAAVVLSGMDGDGSIGIKRIKERGGLTIAQDPDEAQHSGMPRSAIATGMVDWVLRVGQMPSRLMDYAASEKRLRLPSEDGPQPAVAPRLSPSEPEAAFREIIVFLRTRTGRDFSYYKRATILRRISRRMQVNGLDDMSAYLSFLRMNPSEALALLKDLLISVTNFFRDRDCFGAVEARISELFEGKTQSDTVRV